MELHVKCKLDFHIKFKKFLLHKFGRYTVQSRRWLRNVEGTVHCESGNYFSRFRFESPGTTKSLKMGRGREKSLRCLDLSLLAELQKLCFHPHNNKLEA